MQFLALRAGERRRRDFVDKSEMTDTRALSHSVRAQTHSPFFTGAEFALSAEHE